MELRLDPARALLEMRNGGNAVAAVAAEVGMDAPVPSCPGWTVRDLVAHLGAVYAGWAHVVRDRLQERPPRPEVPADDVLGWYRRQHAELLELLRTTEPETPVWTFGADHSVGFWQRRMAHETVIHRADAEFAAGRRPPRVDAVVAIDGIDEVLTVFLGQWSWTYVDEPRSVAVRTPDERWHVALAPAGVTVTRGSAADADADAVVAGTPSHVLYHLWGRLPVDEVEVRGDPLAHAGLLTQLSRVT